MKDEVLIRVAEWLENGAPSVGNMAGFNMCETIEDATRSFSVDNNGNHTIHECGTVCCIAGAIVQFDMEAKLGTMASSYADVFRRCGVKFGQLDIAPLMGESIMEAAAVIAGLPWDIADELFIPGSINLSRATPAQAAYVIRKLLETGEVRWDEFAKTPPVEL